MKLLTMIQTMVRARMNAEHVCMTIDHTRTHTHTNYLLQHFLYADVILYNDSIIPYYPI